VTVSRKFMNIAHRGASSYAPENTFAAFDKALAMGVDHVELDVQFTRDGHIAVIHDSTVDRTTNGSGPVESFTLAELRSLDAGSWFSLQYAGERIRSLGEILEHYRGRLYFHIEIKANAEGLARRTIDMVRGYGVTDSVTITSFHKARLEEACAYDSALPKGWLIPPGNSTPWDETYVAQARELGISQICPRTNLVTPELVKAIHDAGFEARAWGVADEGLMRRVVDAGADGMTINFPDKLVEYLKARGMQWK
jgi:glycerophosphoryl diester phosphodiesterase